MHPSSSRQIVRVIMAAAIAIVAAAPAFAQRTTWTATGSPASWDTTGNWSNGVPVTTISGTAVFAGDTNTATVAVVTNQTVGRIVFESGARAYTISGGNGFYFASGGGVTVNSGVTTNQTLNSNIRTSGTFTNLGTGTLSFGQFLDLGSLTLNATFGGSGDIVVSSIQNRNSSSNVSFIKNGSGTLTITTGGTVAPTGAQGWYTGSTTINGGVIQLGNQWALGGGTGNITFGGGTLRYSGSNNVDYSARIKSSGSAISIDTGGRTVPFATSLPSTNTGGLTKSGSGTLTLSASNAFSGDTLVSTGTLALGDANALFGSTFDTASPGVLSLGSRSAATFGGLKNSGTFTLTNSGSAFALSVGGGTVSSTFAGRLDGLGSLTKVGSGTFTLSGSNAHAGGTRVDGGVLTIDNNFALGTTGSVTFGGGTLRYTANSLLADISSAVVGSGSAISIDTNGQSVTFGSALASSNAGGLTKSGAGTLILSASNAYLGTTTVSAGTLLVNGGLTGLGAVTVDSGATLGGLGSIGGAVTVNGVLSPGTSPGVLSVASLVLGASSTSLFEIDGVTRGTLYDGVDITGVSGPTYGGTLSLVFGNVSAFGNTDIFNLFTFSGTPTGEFATVTSTGFYEGTWSPVSSGTWKLESAGQTLTFSQSTGDIVVVPEPGTLALAGLGIAAAAWARRRRRTHKKPGAEATG